VFFGLHRIGLGFAIICLLWLATAATIAVFYPVSPTAALLLLPYLAWVGFAAALNYAVWGLNRSVPSP
jgi:tryptophan-rich sensory protein